MTAIQQSGRRRVGSTPVGIAAPAGPIAYPDCEHCGGTGLTRGGDQENQCARCALRRHDELSFTIVLCSVCGRSVRLIDTVSMIGLDTHQTYRVCDRCRWHSE
jgi:hypothetical protein